MGTPSSYQRRALASGAGEAARLLLAGIDRQCWTVIGLLDDDSAKHGARIAGVPVLGTIADIARAEIRRSTTYVVLAMQSATCARRLALQLAAAAALPTLTVHIAEDGRDGRTIAERLRDIKPEDLLGREAAQQDEAGIGETLGGTTVLITGAGGSIGSELYRKVVRFAPVRLVLYELSEFNLYATEQDLSEVFTVLPLVRLIGDVKGLVHLRRVIARRRPQVVFHAPAFKDDLLMEEEGNAWAALRNNTVSTKHAELAAAEEGPNASC